MRENESKQNHVSWPNHRYIFFQYKETVGDCITYQCHIYNVFFVLKSASEQFKTGCSLVYSLLQKKSYAFTSFANFLKSTHSQHIHIIFAFLKCFLVEYFLFLYMPFINYLPFTSYSIPFIHIFSHICCTKAYFCRILCHSSFQKFSQNNIISSRYIDIKMEFLENYVYLSLLGIFWSSAFNSIRQHIKGNEKKNWNILLFEKFFCEERKCVKIDTHSEKYIKELLKEWIKVFDLWYCIFCCTAVPKMV